ncbi:MAG TPA: histidinol-phosphate transaminase [Burkholderiales bacterium]|nr:histidinol-phosphate transaminase [Burkholderiales bacterium]
MPQTPEEVIRDEIRAMSGYRVPDATGMVKLDAMENPYPLPAELRPEIARLVESASFNRYPDSGAVRLKARLREVMAVPDGMDILVGNGSDELIQSLMLAAARPGAVVMGLEPSFVMFRLIATFCGMRYVGVPLNDDFSLDSDRMLAAIGEHQPGLIIMAFPNNPTGNLFDPQAIERIIQHAPGMVVLDEAYHAFAGQSFMPRLGSFQNLLVMRTLSKLGLAALRLGMLAGARSWLQHLDKVRLPYNVNVLTQLIAEKVLQHHGLLAEQAAAIRAQRETLYRDLDAIHGVQPYPSEANFILFRVPGADAVFEGLKSRRVLIKSLHGSHPALAQCLRVTVGSPQENAQFIGALKETLNGS